MANTEDTGSDRRSVIDHAILGLLSVVVCLFALNMFPDELKAFYCKATLWGKMDDRTAHDSHTLIWDDVLAERQPFCVDSEPSVSTLF